MTYSIMTPLLPFESKTSTWESENLRRCLIYLAVLEEGDKEGVHVR